TTTDALTHTVNCYTPASGEVGQIIGMQITKRTDVSPPTVSACTRASYYYLDGSGNVVVTGTSNGVLYGPDGPIVRSWHFAGNGGSIAVQFDGTGFQTLEWIWTFAVTKG